LLSNLLFSGIAIGCLYGLVALGFVMIWNTAAIVNFAQGEFAMLGMFFSLTALTALGLPLPLALVMGVLGPAALGLLMDRLTIRPILGADPLSVITVTIGLQILLSNGAKFVWGTQPQVFPNYLGTTPFQIGDLRMQSQSLAIIVSVAVLAVLLHLLSQRTRFGKSLRAVSQNRETASLMGIDVQRTTAFGIAIATGLAGIAGVLMAPITFVSADLGLPLLIKSFIAAVLGGFGSYPGALIGGVTIGVLDNLIGFYISTAYRDVILFGILIVILLVRPQGLFPHHR
jgi:branched-chain amino acid transport system permease protein